MIILSNLFIWNDQLSPSNFHFFESIYFLCLKSCLNNCVVLIMFQMMGQVNKERLAEYLGELQRKENTNDRYVAALRGETLTRKPYVRIQPIPEQTDKEQKNWISCWTPVIVNIRSFEFTINTMLFYFYSRFIPECIYLRSHVLERTRSGLMEIECSWFHPNIY